VFLARIIAFQGVVLMLQNKRPEMGKPEIVWSSQSNLTNVFSMKYLEREYVRHIVSWCFSGVHVFHEWANFAHFCEIIRAIR
jgi:hypothetical protein